MMSSNGDMTSQTYVINKYLFRKILFKDEMMKIFKKFPFVSLMQINFINHVFI